MAAKIPHKVFLGYPPPPYLGNIPKRFFLECFSCWPVSNCPPPYDGVNLSSLPSWCQIVPCAFLVSNCPKCQIVRLSQSYFKVVSKMSRSCFKAVFHLSQSCLKSVWTELMNNVYRLQCKIYQKQTYQKVNLLIDKRMFAWCNVGSRVTLGQTAHNITMTLQDLEC